MKILLLANPNSSHTIKWVTSLAKKGLNIYLFGLESLKVQDYNNFSNINIETLNIKNKILYLKALPKIKNIIKNFKPDIVHAHYASSYGLLGALSGFHPFVLSVWGSDVFLFPKKSFLHRKILEFNFKKADKILSTSRIMAKEIKNYSSKNILITPFGVDLKIFKPMKVKSLFDENDIIIGTVKTLEKIYGIEYLIKAFKILVDKYPDMPLKLLIVGEGSLKEKLIELSKSLNIEKQTVFTGKVPYEEVPIYHNMLTVSVFTSISESFGVSVIEASACEKPVVVSDALGFTEIIENGINGFIVPKQNPQKTAGAIEKLIFDNELRKKMGKTGREKVKKLYNWENNVKQMIQIYNNTLKKGKKC